MKGGARAAVAVAVALVTAGLFVAIYQHNSGWMYDARVYQRGGSAALHGLDVYRYVPPAFTYTPFSALLFIPLVPLPVGVLAFVVTAISVLCLEAVVWLCLGPDLRTLPIWLGAFALALWLDPVSLTLLLGQINLVLLALIVWDLTLPDASRWKGVGTGIAAGIKLTPGLFIVYLALTGRWRAAATGIATFAATVLIGLAALPGDAVRYWGGTFLDSTRVSNWPQNVRSQSLRSILIRITETTHVEALWIPLALLVVLTGLALAVWAHRRGEELLALCLCGMATLLVSPITWQHHWVWMLPLLLWLAQRAWRTRSWLLGALCGLVALELFVRPYQWGIAVNPAADLRLGPLQVLQSSTYAITALLVLALTPWLIGALRPTRRPLPASERAAGPARP